MMLVDFVAAMEIPATTSQDSSVKHVPHPLLPAEKDAQSSEDC